MAIASTQDIATAVRQGLIEPRVEARRIAKRGQVHPGGEECFLDGVEGVRFAAQDGPSHAQRSFKPGRDQCTKGVGVPRSRPLDQVGVSETGTIRHLLGQLHRSVLDVCIPV